MQNRLLACGLCAGAMLLLAAAPPAAPAGPKDPGAKPSAGPVVIDERPSRTNGTVYVLDEGPHRVLRFGSVRGDEQTMLDRAHPEQLVVEYLQHAVRALDGTEPAQALVIGLGGGAVVRHLRHRYARLHIDAVDIDPVVVDVAQAHFGVVADAHTVLHVADGAGFVHNRGRRGPRPPRYDYVLVDAYGARDYPRALGTAQFFDDLKGQLAPTGVVALNLAVEKQARALLLRRFAKAFPRCVRLEGETDDNTVAFGFADKDDPRLPAAATCR